MSFEIHDETVQRAFEYLDEYCDAAAQARADVTVAKYRVKTVRAKLKLSAPRELRSADLREAWAESHEDYIKAYEDEANAVKSWEWHVRMATWAESIRDGWRTLQSNERSVRKF